MRILKFALAMSCGCAMLGAAAQIPAPFANAQWAAPTGYPGTTFALSHAYPSTGTVPAMPWRSAINNQPISTANASAYAEALKAAVGPDMKVLLQDYKNWDAPARGWYNEPWLGAAYREPIHGMYVGSSPLEASLFKGSGLKKPITTYVLTYYDKTAAQTLYNVWGSTAMQPKVSSTSTQFAEGSIVIKAAFITADAAVWPVMKDALSWPLYIKVNATKSATPSANPVMTPTYLMQFDIIVKDSVSAPKTGWVFTTLVYDTRIKTTDNDIWKKMVVLGAQWGNDPEANNPAVPNPVLTENWNNPAAPLYGGETFGWGQRLSGPNDGAMNDIAYAAGTTPTPQKYVKNGKDSSCMSCHSSAQWNLNNQKLGMDSFLLPLTTARPSLPPGCTTSKKNPNPPCSNFLNSPQPGSTEWMKWFQNRKGDVPMDPGSIAGDFDMVLTFKSLPAWYTATQNAGEHVLHGRDLRGKSMALPPRANGKVK
jgi:hypothetical protein